MDIDWRERALLLALLIPILWIGLYPNPFLRRIEPSVLEVVRQSSARQVLGADLSADPGAGVSLGLPALGEGS